MRVREEIVGERKGLSNIEAKRNVERFADLQVCVDKFKETLKGERLQETFTQCFFNTLYTTTFFEKDDSVFIITGDIPAMWLRDSSAQVLQYVHFAEECASVRALIKGLLKKQFQYIIRDPYANAFNRNANANGHIYDLPKQSPWVWERKFELDSLCYPMWLLCKYYKKTQDKDCLNDLFLQAFDAIIKVFKTEQNHQSQSTYRHQIFNRNKKKSCSYIGAVSGGGLVWSGYRPSDDCCKYGYYLPGNMFIVSVLTQLAPIFSGVLGDETRAATCKALADEIQAELERLASVEKDGKRIYALETDGFGNYNLMDDANIPNLLSMPYYEYPYIDKEIYRNTRAYILSKENPYYFEGSVLTGVGSPHTPKNQVWPMSIIMQALTSDDQTEIQDCVRMLINSTGDTGYMHESVHKDNDKIYSRPWFAWANSLFAYLILEKREYL